MVRWGAILAEKKDFMDEVRRVINAKGVTLNVGEKGAEDRGTHRKWAGKSGKGRVLLINPPYRRFMGLQHTCFPLSFGYMASMLKSSGYDVGIYDADFDQAAFGKNRWV